MRNNPTHKPGVLFTPRMFVAPAARRQGNPKLPTPRRYLSPRTFPPEKEPKYAITKMTPRLATADEETATTPLMTNKIVAQVLRDDDEEHDAGKGPKSSSSSSGGPVGAAADKDEEYAVVTMGGGERLEVLGEMHKSMEIMLTLRDFKVEVLRDPATQVYYFRAMEVEPFFGDDDDDAAAAAAADEAAAEDSKGKKSKDSKKKKKSKKKKDSGDGDAVRPVDGIRYERTLSEPQMNRLLVPTERWATSMAPAAADLLKRLLLVPTHKGGRNKRARGARNGLLLTFEGAPDKPKGFAYLKCSRRIGGRLYVIEAGADKDKTANGFVEKDTDRAALLAEAAVGGGAGGGGKGRRGKGGAGGKKRDDGDDEKEKEPATQPAGEVASVLRFRLYDPMSSLYLEAAAPIVLARGLAARRRQVTSAVERLDVVQTASGPAAVLRLTPFMPPTTPLSSSSTSSSSASSSSSSAAAVPPLSRVEQLGLTPRMIMMTPRSAEAVIGVPIPTAAAAATVKPMVQPMVQPAAASGEGEGEDAEAAAAAAAAAAEKAAEKAKAAPLSPTDVYQQSPNYRLQLKEVSEEFARDAASLAKSPNSKTKDSKDDDDDDEEEEDKDKGAAGGGFEVELVVGFTSSDSGPRSSGKPLLLVQATPIVSSSSSSASVPTLPPSPPSSSVVLLPLVPRMPPVGTRFRQQLSVITTPDPEALEAAKKAQAVSGGGFDDGPSKKGKKDPPPFSKLRKLLKGLCVVVEQKAEASEGKDDDDEAKRQSSDAWTLEKVQRWRLWHPLQESNVKVSQLSKRVQAARALDKAVAASYYDDEKKEGDDDEEGAGRQQSIGADDDDADAAAAAAAAAAVAEAKDADDNDDGPEEKGEEKGEGGGEAKGGPEEDPPPAGDAKEEEALLRQQLASDEAKREGAVLLADQRDRDDDTRRWFDAVSSEMLSEQEIAARDGLWEARRDAAFLRRRELRALPKVGPVVDEAELKRQAEKDAKELEERQAQEVKAKKEAEKKAAKEAKKKERQDKKDKKKKDKASKKENKKKKKKGGSVGGSESESENEQQQAAAALPLGVGGGSLDGDANTLAGSLTPSAASMSAAGAAGDGRSMFSSSPPRPLKTFDIPPRKFEPETGFPKWTDDDGMLVFRRAQVLGGRHMIVSVS
jgi:hypothetical protein